MEGGEVRGLGFYTFFPSQRNVKQGVVYLLDGRQSLALSVDCVQRLDVHLNDVCMKVPQITFNIQICIFRLICV